MRVISCQVARGLLSIVVWAAIGSPAVLRADDVVEDTLEATATDPGALPGAVEPQDDIAASPIPPAIPTAQNRFAAPDPALELADPRTYRLKVVIRIEAPEGALKNVVATGPVPMDWPEQRVRLLGQKLSPQARVSQQILKGQAALLKLQVAQIPKGGSAFVERLYEITRYRTKFLLPPEGLKLPRGVPPELKDQLAGLLPGVETTSPKMVELAESLRGTAGDGPAWETIKGFWSWTRDNVKFENGDFRGALHAIENRCGDCEEMSALFVGLCRLSGIPARSVWVESHDYAEFYLVDQQGRGHWIPAQLLGPAWFGEMTEYRPIFQKGDRFYDPLKKEYVRYVPQTVRGSDHKGQPKVEFRHEIIADSDINGPSYANPR
jgi:hypothetical protein